MLASYKRKSAIAAVIFVVSLGTAVALASNRHQNVGGIGVLGVALAIMWTVSYFYALWAYIRAKGRDDKWILMAFLNLLGLVVILMLKDLHKENPGNRDRVNRQFPCGSKILAWRAHRR